VKLEERKTVAIIGQGYVGLPLAMAATEAGWSVVGIDTDKSKVLQINSGTSPVEDVLDLRLRLAISLGRYVATTEYSMVKNASVVVICVPTPLNKNRQPELSLLRNAAEEIALFVSNETLIVSESTSYPGTLREVIIPTILESENSQGKRLYFASAPERVNPGDIHWNQRNTPRLVGGIDRESQKMAMSFYDSICDEAIGVPSAEVAEAAKLLENTFRLVNIALINEFAQICDNNSLNVNEVIDAASSKPYGFMPFRPGVGVGGHCIPVDPLYLTWWARKSGSTATFVETADSINQGMPKYVAERALALISSSVEKPRVLILGVAYKPGVGDVRETPATALRKHLQDLGAQVAWHDPLVSVWDESLPVDLDWECDVAILSINQSGIDVRELCSKGTKILDCTNSLKEIQGVTSL
jgi:UDP-N-acetyl-D-glucosamine dehydrogenase